MIPMLQRGQRNNLESLLDDSTTSARRVLDGRFEKLNLLLIRNEL